MAGSKLNILICGMTSESSNIFIMLYKYLKSYGNEVSFFSPEYSGVVCLIEQKISFIRVSNVESENYLNPDEENLLQICLQYDLKKNEFDSSFIKGIKRKQILSEGHKLFSACKNYFKKNLIDLVIVWGGIKYHTSIPSAVATKNNIPCIFIEKGLYPFTLQVDSQGVNGFGKLKEKFRNTDYSEKLNSLDFYQSLLNERWYFSQPINSIRKKTKLKYLMSEFRFNELLVKLFHKYFETRLLKKFIYKETWDVTNPIVNSEKVEESDYIFIPFQVADDSQLLVQANWIKDNISLVNSVLKSLSDLSIDRNIIVKEHPREYRNINYQEIFKDYNIKFSKAGTIDLISRCKLVVTINSTIGFEALVFCKPVIITGDALYESIPFITKATNESELTSNLKKNLLSDIKFDCGEINRYAAKVYNNLVKCNYVSPSEMEINRLWQRILELR